MSKKITLVYFSIVLLVAGISAILLGESDGIGGVQQITYAQLTTSIEEYPEGHPLAPTQGYPEGTSETPPHLQTQDKPGTPHPPSSTQIPDEGFPEGTSETPSNSQVPPFSPQAPSHSQVAPEAPQPPIHPQVP